MLENHGGEVIVGGETDASERYVAPTVIFNPRIDSPIATEEIFGPVLIVFSFKTHEEVIRFVNEREKPLALYFFGKSKKNFDYVISNTSSGGVAWNDTAMQSACLDMGFGGVGNSGTSKINGKEGFLAFTHRKGVLEAATYNGYPANLRYPPRSPEKDKSFKKLAGYINFSHSAFVGVMKKVLLATGIAVAAKYGYFDGIIGYVQTAVTTQMNRFKS